MHFAKLDKKTYAKLYTRVSRHFAQLKRCWQMLSKLCQNCADSVVAVMWMATSVDTSAETHSVQDRDCLFFVVFLCCLFQCSCHGTGRGRSLSFHPFALCANTFLHVQCFLVRVCAHAFSGLGVTLCEAVMV